ncbi:hypothetical protein H072_10188 [Dactylellina haptotyla CBS 200.50]|uniref:Uncharacterized protein n=1 Tax=Dactylellina haptotyla (strain CBS 200.50) TaxID=1284197 RepID=S7ZZX2_DACHA|nr:hypothetical protein H072_10188 [Dactylellina haptotyla CBS 200.50]
MLWRRMFYATALASSIPLVDALFSVECLHASQPPPEPADTVFVRNLNNFFSIITITPTFQKLFRGIYPDMKFLNRILAVYNDQNFASPTNTLPIIAPAELYEYVVGLKLHCYQDPLAFLKTLIQIDEVEIEGQPPLPESASTADSNPPDMELENVNYNTNGPFIERFQYINDEIAADFLNRLSTLVYQYDQALVVAGQEWPEQQLAGLNAIKSAFEMFRNGLWQVASKARYAGMSLDMRTKELSFDELKDMVADPALSY